MKCTPNPDTGGGGLELLFSQLDVEDDGKCSGCGMVFSQEEDEDKFWICCDMCDEWLCFKCHTFSTKEDLPEQFFCPNVSNYTLSLFIVLFPNATHFQEELTFQNSFAVPNCTYFCLK